MRTILLLVASVVGIACFGAPTAAAAEPSCFDTAAPRTVEEQRLDRPIPQQILTMTGYDRFGTAFRAALCASRGSGADALVAATGRTLWEAAVARAQGKLPATGLDRTDDRPLYWSRLQLSTALRQWTVPDPTVRTRLLSTLDRTTRGQDSLDFPRDHRARRVLVTGFDPFVLDTDIRRSNPSGASALALDGTEIQTAAGSALVQTAVFPVLWDPFAAGTVEHTVLPLLRPGPNQVDLATTISQGRPERFDIERFNGRWRGGFADNDNLSRTGVIPIPADVPTVTPAPEFVPTTLPYQRIVDATTGRFPVRDNTTVVEIPAGSTTPVVAPAGPTPGSTARQGGGGDYLSNEIAYRVTLLRDAVNARIPAGHVHTPVLTFAAGNITEITDPVFVQNRTDIITQVRSILTVAAG